MCAWGYSTAHFNPCDICLRMFHTKKIFICSWRCSFHAVELVLCHQRIRGAYQKAAWINDIHFTLPSWVRNPYHLPFQQEQINIYRKYMLTTTPTFLLKTLVPKQMQPQPSTTWNSPLFHLHPRTAYEVLAISSARQNKQHLKVFGHDFDLKAFNERKASPFTHHSTSCPVIL